MFFLNIVPFNSYSFVICSFNLFLQFEHRLLTLHQAVDHHASSEEASMFKEAQRLGEARLRELGQQTGDMLEHERLSRARSAFRELKIRLREGA